VRPDYYKSRKSSNPDLSSRSMNIDISIVCKSRSSVVGIIRMKMMRIFSDKVDGKNFSKDIVCGARLLFA
jgi:hypothetical protein